MRRSAYLKAINEAMQLPDSIPELSHYFKDGYNPRDAAVRHIVKKAREARGRDDKKEK